MSKRPAPKAPGSRRPAQEADFAERVRTHASAYPNNITFHELIRRNKRDSNLLIAAMIALAVVFGGVLGGAIGPLFFGLGDARIADPFRELGDSYVGLLDNASDISSDLPRGNSGGIMQSLGLDWSTLSQSPVLLPSMLIGAAAMGLAASLGAVWSLNSGSSAILRMSHARPLSKELDPELFNVTEEMAIAAGLPMPRLYLIGDSAMNAFATGKDPANAAVAITTGLRAKLSRDELQAVIAHEIAHVRHYDIRFSMLMATMVGIIVVASDAFLRGLWHGRYAAAAGGSRNRGKGSPLVIILVVLAIIMAIVAPFLARIIQMAYSRQREYLADAGAVELTRNPRGLASALSRLANDPDPLVDTANRGVAHMYIVNPMKKMHDSHQSLNSVFCSHPPLPKRIARILALLK